MKQSVIDTNSEFPLPPIRVAAMIMADCGLNANNRPLLMRIASRIKQYEESRSQPSEQTTTYVNTDLLEYLAEEAECVMMCLNERGVPKSKGKHSLSLWGRVEHYAKSRQPV